MTLSVILITYNHADYIKQAIESILMQKTNFRFELIIGNDHSTDNTEEVIKNLISETQTDVEITYYNHEQNVGLNDNFIWALKQCKGKYLAFCDGDDYWTNPDKLQNQVDFLEANADYSMCFHELEDPKQRVVEKIENREYKDSEIFNDFIIQITGVVCRNDFNDADFRLLESKEIHFLDLVFFLTLANKGKVRGIDQRMSFYRYQQNSFTTKERSINYYIKQLDHLKFLSKLFNGKYAIYNKKRIKLQAYKIFRYYAIQGNIKAIKYLMIYLKQ